MVIAAMAIAAALTVAPARIVDAIRTRDIHQLADVVDPAERNDWIDVVDVIERSRCASIDRFETSVESQSETTATVTMTIEGFIEAAGASHARIPLPPVWHIALMREGNTWRIRSARTEERVMATALLAANDDGARAAILGSARDRRAVLRIAADLMSMRTPALDANRDFDRFLETAAGDDRAMRAYVRRMYARALQMNGDLPGAVTEAANAVALAEGSGDCDVLAEALLGSGGLQRIAGNTAGAIVTYHRCGTLVDDVEDPRIAIKCVYMTGFVDDLFGNSGRTVELSKRYGWSEGIAAAQLIRADVYRSKRENDSATLAYREATRVARSILRSEFEQRATIGLAECTTDLREARMMLEKAWREHYPERAAVAWELGRVRLEQGNYAGAMELFNFQRDTSYANGDPESAAQGDLSAAETARRQHRYATALAHLQRIEDDLRVPRMQTSGSFAWWARATVAGETLRDAGRNAEAIAEFRKAIALLESIRSETSAGVYGRSKVFEDKIMPYVGLIELLAARGSRREALALSERVKARSLTEALANGGVDVSSAMTDDERRRQKALEDELLKWNVARMRGESVHEQLEHARLQLDQFTDDLYFRHPDLALRRTETSPALPAHLPSGTAILDYVVGERRTTLFVIRDRTIEAHVIPIGAAALERRVRELTRRIASRSERYAATSRSLYRTLVAPAGIGDAKLIGIVPDQFLWELPFQALQSADGRALIDQAPLFYAASLTALSRAMERRPSGAPQRRRLLAIGNPTLSLSTRTHSRTRGLDLGPLPDAEREVRTIGQMYGSESTVVTAGDARESAFKSLAAGYDVLHIAAHAFPDDEQPMFSCVVLGRRDSDADDGVLEARELIGMRLPRSELAVLSACESGRGGIARGEGIIGLSWALLIAGTRTAVVSQWSVATKSTADLMIDFHRNLLAGHPAPAAIRNAALVLRHNPRYAHPFYWAPFVAVGAPR